MSAPLSGDWRDFGQGLDLIAALSVNTPGFAVRGRDDSQGRPVALVASLGPNPRQARGQSLSATAIADIVQRAVAAALTERDNTAEANALIATATAKVGPPPPPPTPEDEVNELLARAGSLG